MGKFQFRYDVVWESFPFLLEGAKLTVIITLLGLMAGFLLGVVFGLFKTSRSLFLRKLAVLYVESIRGTPLMVQVMFIYFGLPLAIGTRVPPLASGVAAIALNSGASYNFV